MDDVACTFSELALRYCSFTVWDAELVTPRMLEFVVMVSGSLIGVYDVKHYGTLS